MCVFPEDNHNLAATLETEMDVCVLCQVRSLKLQSYDVDVSVHMHIER
jgi:hypothetical protein